MAHIKVPEGVPGIIGLMKAFPRTSKPLNQLADMLLVSASPSFPSAERETVASYVSYLNQCVFCSESHGAVANIHWQKTGLSQSVWKDVDAADISDRLKSLLKIAGKVQNDARKVTKSDVDAAIGLGATEEDVHDTVLIAAAFCMYNRYVDGLGAMFPPRGDHAYEEMGKLLVAKGYENAV